MSDEDKMSVKKELDHGGVGSNTGMTQLATPFLYRNPHPKTLSLTFELNVENRKSALTTLKACPWNKRIYFRYRTWDIFSNSRGTQVDVLKTLPTVNGQTNGSSPFIVIHYIDHMIKITGTHKITKQVTGSTSTLETEAVIAPLLKLSELCPVEITSQTANKEIENWTDDWNIQKFNQARHTLNIGHVRPGDIIHYGSSACCGRKERVGSTTGGTVWNELMTSKLRNVSSSVTKTFARAFPYNTMLGNKAKYLKVEQLPTGYEARMMRDGVINNTWKQNRVQVYNNSDSLPLMSFAVIPNEDATGAMLEGKTIYNTLSRIKFSIVYDSCDTTHDSTAFSTNLSARNPYYIPSVAETISAADAAYLLANSEDVEPEIYT